MRLTFVRNLIHVYFALDALESEKVCHPMNKVHTHDVRNATAVIVKSNYFFNRWDVSYDRQCKFIVKTAKGEGLFAIIHNMVFRGNNTACLDYVRVSCGANFLETNWRYFPLA